MDLIERDTWGREVGFHDTGSVAFLDITHVGSVLIRATFLCGKTIDFHTLAEICIEYNFFITGKLLLKNRMADMCSAVH